MNSALRFTRHFKSFAIFRTACLSLLVIGLGFICSPVAFCASTSTWNGGSTDFNASGNWTPSGFPTDTAEFSNTASNNTANLSATTNLNELLFDAGASTYTINANGYTLSINGTGIVNKSASTQTINVGNSVNSGLTFNNTASAGNAYITNERILQFNNNSTAGSATISNTYNYLDFYGNSSAGNASISNSATVDFDNTASAGNASISNSGTLHFFNNSTADNASITNSGMVIFEGNSTASTASITNAGGTVDISGLSSSGMTAGSIAGDGYYNLGSKNLTVGGNNQSTSVSGVIADDGFSLGAGGSLTKVGTGTLTLSGVNSYTGGTTIEGGGAIAISQDANLGSTVAESTVSFDNGTLQVVDGSTFTTTRNMVLNSGGNGGGTINMIGGSSMTVAGVISDGTHGAGSLTKDGAGTLSLSGANTYTGGTTINAGTLQAGGENVFGTGKVTVDNGAIFDLNNYNQSIGVHVNNGTTKLGTAVLSASSYSGSGTLSTTLASASSYGKLNITGTATLTGGVLQVVLAGPYIPGSKDTFTVVTAQGINGQFASIDQPAGLSFTADYSATAVTLSLGSIVPYVASANNPNQTAVASALDTLRTSSDADALTVTGNLNTLSTSQLQNAMDQISPASLNGLTQLGVMNTTAHFSGLNQRFSAIAGGGALASGGFEYYNAQMQQNAPTEAELAYNGTDVSHLGIGSRKDEYGNLVTKNTAETQSPLGFFASGVGSFGTLNQTHGLERPSAWV